MRNLTLAAVFILVAVAASSPVAVAEKRPNQPASEPLRSAVAELDREEADNDRIFQKLRQSIAFEPGTRSVTEFADEIGGRFDIPVRIKIRKLEQDGIRPSEAFTLEGDEEPLGRTLRYVLDELIGDLTYTVNFGVLWITTATDAETYDETHLYEVTDLVTQRSEAEAAAFRAAAAHNAEVRNRFAVWRTNGQSVTEAEYRDGRYSGAGFFQIRSDSGFAGGGGSDVEGKGPMPKLVPTRLPSLADYYDCSAVVDTLTAELRPFEYEEWAEPVVFGDRVFLRVTAPQRDHVDILRAVRQIRAEVSPR